jgi:hypothetical protein
MPNWLRFDPQTREFVATNVPEDGLPLLLFLEYEGKRWSVLLRVDASQQVL